MSTLAAAPACSRCWPTGPPRIRAATPADTGAVCGIHAAMSPENLYLRFFSMSKDAVRHGVFGTEALTPAQLATVAPFPFIVWCADEIRWLVLGRVRARCAVARGDLSASQIAS